MNANMVEMRPGEANVIELRPKAALYYQSLIANRKRYCESNGHYYARSGNSCRLCGTDLTHKPTHPSNIIDLRRALDADHTPNKSAAPKIRITGVPAAMEE